MLFDAAGTLIHLPRGVGFHYAEVAQRHGVACDEKALNRAFATAWQSMPSRTNNGRPRDDDDRGWWRQLVDQTLDTVNAPPFDRDAYFEELYSEFTRPGVWDLFPEVPRVLEILAPRFTLGIVSNFDARLRVILRQFGLLSRFKEIILSSEMGVDKPDRAIFTTAIERLGLGPEEVCYVGDDPKLDWEAAERVGLRVFRLDRRVNDLTMLVDWLGV
ncbi:MAG: HAD-IA family hydrolase [Verrucomicrobiota bacterium]|nr:HAD-IA family hydrolase [Verrucomicrobiota bacterium]